ncbi:DUF1963 domain-containing protein [Streptomyces sp. NPDC048253]|uniref:DUF1963 domain-containing protein n=1 Tax=Streptomyces sp. NPDC048253 TaxID=3365524 RepID=UPI00370FF97D
MNWPSAGNSPLPFIYSVDCGALPRVDGFDLSADGTLLFFLDHEEDHLDDTGRYARVVYVQDGADTAVAEPPLRVHRHTVWLWSWHRAVRPSPTPGRPVVPVRLCCSYGSDPPRPGGLLRSGAWILSCWNGSPRGARNWTNSKNGWPSNWRMCGPSETSSPSPNGSLRG